MVKLDRSCCILMEFIVTVNVVNDVSIFSSIVCQK